MLFNPKSTVEHWYPAKPNESGAMNGKVKKSVTIPPAIVAYNSFKNKVDVFDQYCSYLKFELKSWKFWHPIFWFVMESAIAMVNAWLL
jgi:Transposase IS4